MSGKPRRRSRQARPFGDGRTGEADGEGMHTRYIIYRVYIRHKTILFITKYNYFHGRRKGSVYGKRIMCMIGESLFLFRRQ